MTFFLLPFILGFPFQEYNTTLDTRLLYPVLRRQAEVDEEVGAGGAFDVEMVANKLREINKDYLDRSKQYDKLYEEYQRTAQEIVIKVRVVLINRLNTIRKGNMQYISVDFALCI